MPTTTPAPRRHHSRGAPRDRLGESRVRVRDADICGRISPRHSRALPAHPRPHARFAMAPSEQDPRRHARHVADFDRLIGMLVTMIWAFNQINRSMVQWPVSVVLAEPVVEEDGGSTTSPSRNGSPSTHERPDRRAPRTPRPGPSRGAGIAASIPAAGDLKSPVCRSTDRRYRDRRRAPPGRNFAAVGLIAEPFTFEFLHVPGVGGDEQVPHRCARAQLGGDATVWGSRGRAVRLVRSRRRPRRHASRWFRSCSPRRGRTGGVE